MFEAVTGFSDELDTDRAIGDVLSQCRRGLGGRTPGAGLLFCATEFDHGRMLARINAEFPRVRLIGCTTDGEMSGSGGFSEDGISLTLLCADQVRIGAGLGVGVGADPEGAANLAVSAALEDLGQSPRLAMVLPDGLTGNASRILAALNDRLGPDVPVVGGMTADRVGGNKHHYATQQFYRDRVMTDSIVLLLFGGPLKWSLGVESGWSPVGEVMTVTRSRDNVLYELDGRPALDAFSYYLGEVMRENLAGLGSYPLAVYENDDDHFYLRVARSADPEVGTVDFLAEVPEGARVQLTQAVRDDVACAAARSIEAALARYPDGDPALALLFSCTGRKIVLGSRAREEVAAVVGRLRSATAVGGFYTFGELGPVADGGRSRYHNTTFISLLLGE